MELFDRFYAEHSKSTVHFVCGEFNFVTRFDFFQYGWVFDLKNHGHARHI